MDTNDKITKEAERDRAWADLRAKRNNIYDLIMGKNKFSLFDIVFCYHCVALVIEDLELYHEYYSYLDEEAKNFITNPTADVMVDYIIKEKEVWNFINDEKQTTEDRIKKIEEIRRKTWAIAATKIEDFKKLLSVFPKIETTEDILLVFNCLALIVMELDLKDKEIDILEGKS